MILGASDIAIKHKTDVHVGMRSGSSCTKLQGAFFPPPEEKNGKKTKITPEKNRTFFPRKKTGLTTLVAHTHYATV